MIRSPSPTRSCSDVMRVEVERKFVCNSDVHEKLREIGAVCVGQCEFEDKYFDCPEHHLTLRDVWLRCRQGSWELKCPTQEDRQERGEQESHARSLLTRYREITSLPEIIAKVREVTGEECAGHGPSRMEDEGMRMEDVDECSLRGGALSWLNELHLVPFAVFSTKRCSFTLAEEGQQHGVRVDLDQADFGFCVGEIEVLLPDGGEMQPALEQIERTAQRLGLSGEKRVPGKMDAYLQKYCPEHYKKLLNAKIL
uniref:Thiamine-triphosphatase n=2 Tax=Scleropages formosus TaxID=113540 RepID=A0A8C9V309_SCLFO